MEHRAKSGNVGNTNTKSSVLCLIAQGLMDEATLPLP